MHELHQDPKTNTDGDLLRELGNNNGRLFRQDPCRVSPWLLFSSNFEGQKTRFSTWRASEPNAMLHWFLENQPTGTLVVNNSHPSKATNIQLSVNDQISLITRYIGLGKSQLATIFGVSRQTLYDWLKGNITATGINAERIALLARAMHPSCDGLERSFYHGFISEPPARGEASIMELLSQSVWEEQELKLAFNYARRLTDQRAQALGLSHRVISRSVSENNMLDNGIASGLE